MNPPPPMASMLFADLDLVIDVEEQHGSLDGEHDLVSKSHSKTKLFLLTRWKRYAKLLEIQVTALPIDKGQVNCHG